jgi:CHASE2 domain-containing sensor protein
MRIQGRTLIPGRLPVGWLCVLVLGTALHFLSPLRLLDLKLLDQGFAAIRGLTARPVADSIAIIGIDDDTLRAFPEPIALWHPYLGSMLRALAQAQPRAVGVDIELPERSYDFGVEAPRLP